MDRVSQVRHAISLCLLSCAIATAQSPGVVPAAPPQHSKPTVVGEPPPPSVPALPQNQPVANPPAPSGPLPTFPKSTAERLHAALVVDTDPQKYPKLPVSQTGDCSAIKQINIVRLHWGASGSGERLRHSGDYCFVMDNVNRGLYDYSFQSSVPATQQSALDLLTDAIKSASGLGVTSAKPPLPGARACSVSTVEARDAATQLQQALDQMKPGKDASGTVIGNIDYGVTRARFEQSVTPAFRAFETSIGTLIGEMKDDAGDTSCQTSLPEAEALVLDTYLPARAQFKGLDAQIHSPQVVYYERRVQNYFPLVVTADASYAGGMTSAKQSTFSFDPAFSLVTSSVGFMITELPSRGYTSVSAPSSTAPTTATQNVLAVSNSSGVRPTIDALVNVNVPGLNTQNYGLGISSGVVFDVSNGKADTSNFGFFGGISARITDHLYLTPGVHIGQFADFPQGFDHAGQIIPPNTGTPTAVKRYTARFGISISYKFKDLYSPKASAGDAVKVKDESKTGSSTGAQPATGAK